PEIGALAGKRRPDFTIRDESVRNAHGGRDDSTNHAPSETNSANIEDDRARGARHVDSVDRDGPARRLRGERSKVMLPDEQGGRPAQSREGQIPEEVVSIPSLNGVSRMERFGHIGRSPGPHIA